MYRGQPLLHRLLAGLLALALTLPGFGQAARPASALDPVIAAYLQAGGALDALCLGSRGEPGPVEHRECPLCTPGHGFDLAVFDAAAMAITARDGEPIGRVGRHLTGRDDPCGPPVRAPPPIVT